MIQDTITIPRTEHSHLLEVEAAYETLRELFFASAFVKPATKDRKEIMRTLRKTKQYPTAFLKSLEAGLKDSTYFAV